MTSINPQTFLNGYFSTQRNMYLTSAIGLTIFGVSSKTKDELIHNTLEYTSLFMFLYSCSICVINNFELNRMHNLLKSDAYKGKFDESLNLDMWNKYLYLNLAYVFILIILVASVIEKKFDLIAI
jgi:hypothetical protein